MALEDQTGPEAGAPPPEGIHGLAQDALAAVSVAQEQLRRDADALQFERESLQRDRAELEQLETDLKSERQGLEHRELQLAARAEQLEAYAAELADTREDLMQMREQLALGQQEVAARREELRAHVGAPPRFPLRPGHAVAPIDVTVSLPTAGKGKPKPAAGQAAEQFRKLRRDAKRRAIGA